MSEFDVAHGGPRRDYLSRLGSLTTRLSFGPAIATAAILAVLVMAVVFGGLVVALATWFARSNSAPAFTSSGPTVERLQSMGEIVSTRVVVSAILEGKGEGYRGSWLIRGDALLTCDLNDAAIVTSDEATRTATIRVPGVHVLSPRVDHTRSKTWDLRQESWIPWPRSSSSERPGSRSTCRWPETKPSSF